MSGTTTYKALKTPVVADQVQTTVAELSANFTTLDLVAPVVVTSATHPGSPYEGMIIYETDTDKVLFYDGTAWRLNSGLIPCTSATRPTAYTGLVIYETDTGRILVYNGSAWSFVWHATEPRQLVTNNPGGNIDANDTGYTNWVTGTASIPTWATKAYVQCNVAGLTVVTGATEVNFRLKFGTVNGTNNFRFHCSGITDQVDRFNFSIAELFTLSGTGSQTIAVQDNRTSGSGTVRADTESTFSWMIFYE